MASWQFDVHLVPRDGVLRHYQAIPTVISPADPALHQCWEGVSPTGDLGTEFSKLLPGLKSWHDEISRWGTEEGDRIEVVKDNGHVSDVLVRFDVRNISLPFLIGVLRIAHKSSWVIFSEDGRLIAPSLKKLLLAIQGSPAYRFVQDPAHFLEALRKTDEPDSDGSA